MRIAGRISCQCTQSVGRGFGGGQFVCVALHWQCVRRGFAPVCTRRPNDPSHSVLRALLSRSLTRAQRPRREILENALQGWSLVRMPVMMCLCHDCGEGRDGWVKKEADNASMSQGSKLSSDPTTPTTGHQPTLLQTMGKPRGWLVPWGLFRPPLIFLSTLSPDLVWQAWQGPALD